MTRVKLLSAALLILWVALGSVRKAWSNATQLLESLLEGRLSWPCAVTLWDARASSSSCHQPAFSFMQWWSARSYFCGMSDPGAVAQQGEVLRTTALGNEPAPSASSYKYVHTVPVCIVSHTHAHQAVM